MVQAVVERTYSREPPSLAAFGTAVASVLVVFAPPPMRSPTASSPGQAMFRKGAREFFFGGASDVGNRCEQGFVVVHAAGSADGKAAQRRRGEEFCCRRARVVE